MSAHFNALTGQFLLSEQLISAGKNQFYDLQNGDIVFGDFLVPKLGNTLFDDATLDLNFANDKSLTDRISGDNLVTFARASSATYVDGDGVIKTTPVNLLLRSEEFNQVSWLKSGTNVSINQITSPRATVTADKLFENTLNSTHLIYQLANSQAGTSRTFSVYAKAAERTIVGVAFSLLSDAGIYVDLSDGSFVSALGALPDSHSIENAGDGWYRISVTDDQNNGNPFVILSDGSPATSRDSYLGDGASGVYLWGAQLEEGSTVADYIPTTSTISGAPRFDHDPVTGESLGLLIEEARTNLIPYSSPANLWWTKTNLNDSSVSVDNPFNYSTVRLHRATSFNFKHYFHRNDSNLLSANTDYTFSAFVAPEGTGTDSGKVQLRIFSIGANSGFVNFNLNTGQSNAQAGTSGNSALGSSWSISDYGMQPYADGWYRVWMTFRSTLTCAVGIVSIDTLNATDLYEYSSAATGGYYVTGIQVEQGTFRTSAIFTDGATVTRAADVAEITGTNFSSWYNQSEGTVFIDAGPTNQSSVSAGRPFMFHDGTSDNRLGGNLAFTTTFNLFYSQGGNSPVDLGSIPSLPKDITAAIAYKSGDYRGAYDGNLALSDSTAAVPFVNTLSLGFQGYSSTAYHNGHIKRLAYFPIRKTDEELQELTR